MLFLDVIVMTPSTNGKATATDAKIFYESVVEKWASIKDRFQRVTGQKVDWVLRNGLECDLDKNLDYYMHGFGELKPPWILVMKPADRLFIFVTFGHHGEFHIEVSPNQTVGQLKQDLMTKFKVPVHTQRLIFKGAQMKDERELADYGLKRDDRVECTMRLPGGGGFAPFTKYFVDVSRSDLMREVNTVPSSPDQSSWKGLAPGLTLEGRCTNSCCPAAMDEESTHVNMNYGTFDVILDKCACPECSTNFQPTTCGFHYCEWSFSGVKMVKDEPQSVEGPWKSVPSGKYHYFDDKGRGKRVRWARLLLLARPMGALQTKCSLCNGALVHKNKFESPCRHVFHQACWDAYTTVGSQQNDAISGVLCPICRANVPNTAAMRC